MIIDTFSYDVREFCRDRLKDQSNGFNYWYQVAAVDFNVQQFVLVDQGSGVNLLLGRYDYPEVQKCLGRWAFPSCVLSVAKVDALGSNQMRVTPSQFSGQVVVSFDFYVEFPLSGLPPDGDAVYFALESSMIKAFNAFDTYAATPMGTSYNNEIMGEPGVMQRMEDRWLQRNCFTLVFARIA